MLLSNGMIFKAILDNADIQYRGEFTNLENLRNSIDSVMESIIASHAFYSLNPLSYARVNWIELKDNIACEKTVVVFFDPAFKMRGYPNETHADNESFRKACKLFPLMEKHTELRLAVKDYRLALLQSGEDVYFYAYRAVENIRRHFSTKEQDWQPMHKVFGTNEKYIEPLTTQSKNARHGNYSSVLIDPATRKSV